MTAVGRAWPGRARRVGLVARLGIGVAAVAAVATLAGCDRIAATGFGQPASSSAASDRIHQQAQDALDRWDKAVRDSGGPTITFTGDLTSQIGNWEPGFGDTAKVALLSGAVVAATELSTDRPDRGKVKWVDGKEQDVNVLSAAAALAKLIESATGQCVGCEQPPQPLRVTAANLATSLAETSRGPAEVPTWVYTVAGTSVRITRVAVDDSVTVNPPPWNANDPPVGISIDHAVGTEDSTELKVSFVGAPKTGDKPCGADYAAEAVESDLAIVVIVVEHPNLAGGACDLVGGLRTATVHLAAPLGKRTVLEVKEGLPVPVTAP